MIRYLDARELPLDGHLDAKSLKVREEFPPLVVPPMSLHADPPATFDFFSCRPPHIEVSHAPLSSDAGLLPIRQFDQRIRLSEQVAGALHDRRDPALVRQSLLSMVRQRLYGILAD
jgi:hypothetical protein